jgi:hypothetical protein
MGMVARQNAGFDNYTPKGGGSNHFDPRVKGLNNATGTGAAGSQVISAGAGTKMQVNLTLTNPTAVSLTFELFFWLNSCTRVLNPNYVNGNYKYIPLLTLEGFAAFAGGHGGVIGFSQDGSLQIQGDPTVPQLAATIQCKEIGYNSFFEASGIVPFKITSIRYTCVEDLQIDEVITYIQKSYSGGTSTNPVSPRSYFKPTQFQSFTIDLPVEMDINIESGFTTVVLPAETVRLALFITDWTNQAIGSSM